MVLHDITSSTSDTVHFLQKMVYSNMMSAAQVLVLKVHGHLLFVRR